MAHHQWVVMEQLINNLMFHHTLCLDLNSHYLNHYLIACNLLYLMVYQSYLYYYILLITCILIVDALMMIIVIVIIVFVVIVVVVIVIVIIMIIIVSV